MERMSFRALMVSRLIILMVLMVLGVKTFAGTESDSYAVNLIPDELKEGAVAVIRGHQTKFTVLSIDKGIEKVRYAITILDKTADDKARLVVHYDKLHKVKSIEGKLFDASGRQIEKLRKKDIKDQSNFQSFSLFEDNRVKLASFHVMTYPYTVVWEYEVETVNMMFYPAWVPQYSRKLAVESAELEVEVPADFGFRYQEQLVNPVVKKKNTNTESYFWKVSGLKVVEPEPGSPGFIEIVPVVRTAPSEFSVEGYAGTMDSWQSFGAWFNLLNKNRNDLSPETAGRVRKLTEGVADPLEKVKLIYEYLQKNTRYVNISLGIGGWQPFKASFVDEKKYGDCKALSNYTRAMLEAAGIPAYYTLIKHGDDRDYLKEDFVRSYFNHVILCVPLEGDTIWLECTSQTNPFGFLGSSTSGRKVVLITDKGGKIAGTRKYMAEDNLQKTEAIVYISGKSAKAKLKRTYAGMQFENGHLNHYIHQDKEEHKKWIYGNLKIPSYDLDSFTLSLSRKDVVPEASLQAEINLKSLVTISSKRMFINPNLANRHEYVPEKVKERKTDFIIGDPFLDEDRITYHLPEEYSPEFLPPPVKLETRFGRYEMDIKHENNQLLYKRTFKLNEGRFPPEEYDGYVQFMQDIRNADLARVVLVSGN